METENLNDLFALTLQVTPSALTSPQKEGGKSQPKVNGKMLVAR